MYNSAVVYSDVSDHLPIAVHIKMSAPKFKQDSFAQRRFFDNSSIDKFNRLLANVDWDVLLNDNVNASDGYDKFSSVYIDIFNNCFPERIPKMSHRLTPRHEWMTKGLMK